MKFELGQTVLISIRSFDHLPFEAWKQGSISAIGDNCARVNVKGLFGMRQLWIRLDHPLWQVSAVRD